ncbi:MAG TPA: L,D-transpeptidase family protein [Vicinamibacterales bacterium]|nr:L,D-transpeptidase family protein [Vicinamibacterales bacterium]
MTLLSAVLFSSFIAQAPPAPPQTQPVPTPKAAPAKQAKGAPASQAKPATDVLALQVALDRAGFSPGVIDGKSGTGTKKALEAHRQANGGEPQMAEPTMKYRITDADVAGPFEPQMPRELPDQAKLPALTYKTLLEALAERFHSTPAFLQRTNPGAKFGAGEEITVPNVEPMVLPASRGAKTDAAAKADPSAKPDPAAKPEAASKPAAAAKPAAVVVTVTKSSHSMSVTDPDGKVLMYAPVTTGSAHDPLPIGEWKVNGVALNPTFRYNPKLFWDADPTHTGALLKAGPNNPVGLVWVDISKEHYGLHGTPEPSTVGKTASHGCVRLTNWDALKLAGLVKPGTKVVFKP